MLFNSINYLVFFPVIIVFYFILPQKLRNLWLLGASYFFYMNWNPRYAILLAAATGITYVSGLFLGYFRAQENIFMCKVCVAAGFFLNLGMLAYFKYADFAIENMNRLIHLLGQDTTVPRLDLVLPAGISFFVFQSLTYVMDLYRGEVKPVRNIVNYALFVSFFPQILAGPIERSKNMLVQYETKHYFDIEQVRRGLLWMAWGLFLKLVLADRIAVTVDMVYGAYDAYSGLEILIASILYAVQIYCDFAGYSYLAIGSARILGFGLMENFRCPYLAMSIGDFWKRWHISLTSWFRDYLYIPLGGNRKGKVRRYINVFIIFLASGIWHGAAWTYVIWGCLNGGLMIAEGISAPARARLRERLHIRTDRFSYGFFQRLVTFILIDITWIFFRADGVKTACLMIGKIVTDLRLNRISGMIYNNLGMTAQTMVILLLSILVLTIVDIMKYRGISVTDVLFSQSMPFRWMVYMALLFAILLFGVYGRIYEQTAFLYFKF